MKVRKLELLLTAIFALAGSVLLLAAFTTH
jgi:hypothetical protein